MKSFNELFMTKIDWLEKKLKAKNNTKNKVKLYFNDGIINIESEKIIIDTNKRTTYDLENNLITQGENTWRYDSTKDQEFTTMIKKVNSNLKELKKEYLKDKIHESINKKRRYIHYQGALRGIYEL